MPKIYQFTQKDKSGKINNVGRMEIKNQTDTSAELYFYGDIVGSSWESYWSDEDMCPQDVQNFLSELDNDQNIDIYINSGGGDVFGGLAIYNMLKRNTANKTAHVDGLAASIASVIALAADTVIIPNTAQFMIHNPWAFMFGGYSADDCRQMANSLDACSKSILNVYKEHLQEGVTEDTIQELMNNETWMTGEEAAQYFNVQIEETADIAACANSEYFNKYKHTPKNLVKPKSSKKSLKTRDGVVPPNISTETADENTSWAAPILADFTNKSWDDLSDSEKKDIAGHYAWAEEMPPDDFGNLKLPHHKPSDGKVVWEGVANAAARLDTTDIPEEDKVAVRNHLGEHYKQFGKTPPWEETNGANKMIVKNQGRALSAENEQRIRDAQALLDEVLEQLDGNSNDDGNNSENNKDIKLLKAKLALECEL